MKKYIILMLLLIVGLVGGPQVYKGLDATIETRPLKVHSTGKLNRHVDVYNFTIDNRQCIFVDGYKKGGLHCW